MPCSHSWCFRRYSLSPTSGIPIEDKAVSTKIFEPWGLNWKPPDSSTKTYSLLKAPVGTLWSPFRPLRQCVFVPGHERLGLEDDFRPVLPDETMLEPKVPKLIRRKRQDRAGIAP